MEGPLIIAVSDDPTEEELSFVGSAIRERLSTFSLEDNERWWRAQREAQGIPHPQEDPKGFERWIESQYAKYAANR